MEEVVEPRAKRLKKDKGGRFAALERLRGLKGSKHKYEIDEVENVYDSVDERDYVKKVLDRQDDDWIVDDDGSGYVEDGREIFDDDLDTQSLAQAAASHDRGKKRKKKAVSENAGKGNLQYMLSKMPTKKKEEAKLEEDDLLSEIISEIDAPSTSSVSSKSASKPKKAQRFSVLAEKQAVKDYMRSLNASKPKVAPKRLIEESEDIKVEVEVLKEIQQNEAVVEEEMDVVVEKPVEKKNKLLFKIEEPKEPVEVKVEDVSQEDISASDFNFDDDFDFEQIDDFTPKEETVEITEEQLAEGCTFNAEQQETDTEEMSVPEFSNQEDTNGFRFFWWDAFEDEQKHPGTVLLFGKTYSEEKKAYISCCVTVKNVERRIFLLPRPYVLDKQGEPTDQAVTMMDVYKEFENEVAKTYNLKTYKSKMVTKNYAFDPTVPVKSEYLEIRYEGYLNISERRFKTFSHVFGLNSSFLEIFLLERKIKGPCWLNVTSYMTAKNPWTHTAMEIHCLKPKEVSVLQSEKPVPPPPLVVLAVNMKMTVNKSGKNEIAMISCLVNNKYQIDRKAPNPLFQDHFCVFTKLSDQMLPIDVHTALTKYKATRVQKLDSERGLLNYFLGQFSKIDPDLVVGHDLTGYQISILGERLINSKISNISRLSKIKRSNDYYNNFKVERHLFSGRLVCDLKISAKELIRARSYDLDTLCQNVLKDKVMEGQRVEIEPENVPKMYETSMDLFKMISITMQDTYYILKMMFELNVMPLALQITNIAGNIMSRTLMGGRSERNEFLLLHAFNEKDFIVPEKERFKKKELQQPISRKKPTYSGGLVLEPKVGFYDKYILLMDFNSLYPSIIQEYNICFTTIPDTGEEEIVLPDKSVPPGILPTEIRKLVESRREVKKLMKAPDLSQDLRMQYDIRQMALKLTANSMYGCLGFSKSRFFAKNLAALVTQRGREILTNTKDIVMKLCFDVIYGDTDSIMINTNSLDYEQVFKIGKHIKMEINKRYKQIELDIDGVFKYLLLLKKKKYAAVTLVKEKNGRMREVQEFKGLDIVRRDWSQLAAEAGKHVLNQILCEQSQDERIEKIHGHLGKLKEDIEANKVPLQLLTITKQLTKEPHMYTEKNSLPHVLAALRHNKKKGKKFKAGDTVPYVICRDGSSNAATQRAYLLDELKQSSDLTIDTNYYLAQQIHPVISRICEPIDGTDSYQIANCLGLDSASFKKPVASSGGNQLTYENFKKAEIKFRNVKPFVFKCIACTTENKVSNGSVLARCNNMECDVRPYEYLGSIKNQLILAMRGYIQKYYVNEMTCEDPTCVVNTTKLPQKFGVKLPVCVFCSKGFMYRVYNEEELYSQLLYFKHIFDVGKIDKKVLDQNMELACNQLRETVENVLKHSGYACVNLEDLFSNIALNKKQQEEEVMLDTTQIYDDDNDEEL